MLEAKKTIEVKLGSLVLKGRWRSDLDEKNVAELKESFAQNGQLVPIKIAADKTVIWGYHRIAAAKDLGWKTIRAEVGKGTTDEEIEAAALDENLARRHLSLAERAPMLARRKALYEAEHPDATAKAKRAEAAHDRKRKHKESSALANGKRAWRVKCASKQAESFSSRVAKATGRSTRAVQEDVKIGESLDQKSIKRMEEAGVDKKRMLWVAATEPELRADAIEEAIEDAKFGRASKNGNGHAPKLALPLEAHGVDFPAEAAELVAIVARGIREVDQKLRDAQARLTRLRSDLEVHKASAAVAARIPQSIERALSDLASQVRGVLPTDACVFCKLQPSITKDCGACRGSGFLVAGQIKDAPKELLAEGAAAGVFVAGKFKKLAEIAQ